MTVSDPYRWLEGAGGAELDAWITAQNDTTQLVLSRIASRSALRRRFEQLLCYPRFYDFYRRGPYLLFKKNDGLQPQLVLHVQAGITGKPQVLIDPMTLARDGSIRIATFALSGDASHLAYGLSTGGSDWQELRVMHMTSRRNLPDRVCGAKGLRPAWQGGGFYYSRYPAGAAGTSPWALNENHQIWYHRIGTSQAEDRLVYQDPQRPHRVHLVQTTPDERSVVLTIADAQLGHSGGAVSMLDSDSSRHVVKPLVTGFEHQFRLVGARGTELLFLTNHLAANRRVITIDALRPEVHNWREVIPERGDPIDQVVSVGGRLFVTYRRDACHRLWVFDCSGRVEEEIQLPEPGVVTVFEGEDSDSEALWSFTTFTRPPTVFRYQIATRQSVPFASPPPAAQAKGCSTTQVFYPAKDRTPIPMFIVHKAGLELNSKHPALVCGYGGGGISMGPSFDPLLPALLERGVILAVACLRGGGEYGRSWHDAGRRERKQTVFDDCIAALEWLQASGYTKSDRTALIGSSNGGLLVGAVMTQRPDLLAVALPGSGVMDMLRFQQFTVGHAWIDEYGTSDDPALFPTLLAYSPLHNLRKGVRYPATLVTTSRFDDRVVPAHSYKFTAALQATGAGPGPYLIRIDSDSGHGAVSLQKEIAERADIYAFLLAHLAGTAETCGDDSATSTHS